MKKQVDKKHYSFERYVHLDRWVSYYYQISEVLKLSHGSVFEVGVGDKTFGNYIKSRGIIYTSMDVANDLNPDIVGSVEDIPANDNTYDVSCAFEVLEHLPFEKFEVSLKELSRISKKYVVISLPHFGPSVKLHFKFPLINEIRISFKIPIPIKHIFNGEHYWEIGKKGFSIGKIRKILREHFIIERDFVPFDNQYHHFFVLIIKNA